MVVTLPGRFAAVRDVQLQNAYSPIVVSVDGNTTVCSSVAL